MVDLKDPPWYRQALPAKKPVLRSGSIFAVRRSLTWFLVVNLSLGLISLFYAAVCGWVLHLPYPRNWLLYKPVYRFSDLLDYAGKAHGLMAGRIDFAVGFPLFNYSPPAMWVDTFFLTAFSNPAAALVLTEAAFLLSGIALFIYALNRTVFSFRFAVSFAGLTALAAFPFWFLFDRGNLEGLIWGFLLVSLVCFVRSWYWMGALFLGLTICIKPTPVLLFLLFIERRRYKEALAGALLFIPVTIAALAALGPTILEAFRTLPGGAKLYFNIYVIGYRSSEIGVDHSLFSVFKQVARLVVGIYNQAALARVIELSYLPYIAVCIALAAATFYSYRKLPLLNQLFAIVILMVVLPPCSYEYNLVQLYFPLVAAILFFAGNVADGQTDFIGTDMLRILVPCAVVLSPLNFLTIGSYTAIGGQIKVLALIYLLVAGAQKPMRCSLLQEKAAL